MGELLAPRAWCRQRWCREEGSAEHHLGDGCSCDPRGRVAAEAPRLVELNAKAARLAAFACRACGKRSRRMVEQPVLFFRCEACASEDRWPTFTSPARRAH